MGYDSANPRQRVVRTWHTRLGNSDFDDLRDLSKLRANSRDAYRNQPIVTGAIDTKLNNTIGFGLTLQSTPVASALGISADEASAWSRRTELEFSLFANSVNCDIERTKTFSEIQQVAFISHLISGDVPFMLPMIDRGGPYKTVVKLFEADQLCNPNFMMDTDKVAGGVEVDKNGAPLAYYFSDVHPGGYRLPSEWVRVPAFGANGRQNVYLYARRVRPGRKRGIPILAPVLNSLKTLSEYRTAGLEAALVSGLYTVFIKQEGGEFGSAYDDADDGTAINPEREMKLAPGMAVMLNPGEDIETANPGRPNPNFDPFVTAILKEVGAALQLPLEILMKHFQSSYSASRAALLEAWKEFKSARTRFGMGFCQPIYMSWLDEAVAIGRLDAPGYFNDPLKRMAWASASWNGPIQGQLDPVKETRAAQMRVEQGFSTRQREAAEMNGSDFELNTTAAARENKLMIQSGLKETE
jgi:lambda family phage portal protein